MKDEQVSTGSAGYYDYKGSGYTRGHLVPAGDMAHNKESMYQTFYMSNISPQLRVFNNGIWKELEEQTRDWVYHNDELYIVSGPIFTSPSGQNISKKNITVPDAFYKIILDNEGKSRKAIAFVIPHKRSEDRLQDYAVTIDSVENLTGIDFFKNLEYDPLINRLEGVFDIEEWDFSDARYKLRIERWNNQ